MFTSRMVQGHVLAAFYWYSGRCVLCVFERMSVCVSVCVHVCVSSVVCP